MNKLYLLPLLFAALFFASCDNDDCPVLDHGNVLGITLDRTTCSLALNKTLQLHAIVDAECAGNKALIWTSADAAIATVDKEGVVTGKSIGQTVITVTSDADASKTATCTITVSEKTMVLFDKLTDVFNENHGFIALPFRLTAAMDKDVIVTFGQGLDDRQTAREGVHFDYINEQKTVILPAGTLNGVFQLRTIDNTTADSDVFFDMVIKSVSEGVELAIDSLCRVTIRDNDYELYFSKTSFEVNEGQEIEVPFYLSLPAPFDVQINILATPAGGMPMEYQLVYDKDKHMSYNLLKGQTQGSFKVKVGHVATDYRDWELSVILDPLNPNLTEGFVSFVPHPAIITVKNIDEEPVFEPEVLTKIGFASLEYSGWAAGTHQIKVNCPSYPVDMVVFWTASSTTLESGFSGSGVIPLGAHQTTADISFELSKALAQGESIEVKFTKVMVEGKQDDNCLDPNRSICVIKP